MNTKWAILLLIILAFAAAPASAQEAATNNAAGAAQTSADNATSVPEDPIAAAQKKAERDAKEAAKEAALKEAEILFEQGALQEKIAEMEEAKQEQEKLLESLNEEYNANDKETERLQKRIEAQEGAMDEVSGTMRGIAQDTMTVLRSSLVSGDRPGRDKLLEPLVSELEFPTLENIKILTDIMFEEIALNGTIATKQMTYVDAAGKETSGEVTRIGAFNAVFKKEGRVGYLEYAPVKQAFHQLIVEPPSNMTREVKRFLGGSSAGIYLDLSAGGAFRQLTDMPDWYDQIKAGGALMYPLLFVGLAAIVLMAERLFVLLREGRDSESLSKTLTDMLQKKKWDDALRICTGREGSLASVMRAGISHRHERSEVLESVMQEAIQSALPRLERNMSILSILGMVAPLIGLLGTVTGMIATFQMITLYGTGDPKIMSGGISEALITTQYGLIVAVPIILVHGYFQGRIDRLIGMLEEKSIVLVNSVSKESGSGAA